MPQLLFSFDALEEAPPLEREADAYGHVLSPEQARVRDAGAGHMVVIAGAGTGKTELLTQRVLKLLLEGDGQGQPAQLEEVVALTFTNKAAAEMRTRVYRALVRRLRSTTNTAERTRLQELRARFGEDNRIWTFDSLGSRLLQLFPDHSPLPRGARLPTAGEERALVRALGRAFWAWADNFDEADAEELFAFLDVFERREQALALIRDTARRPKEELRSLATLPEFGDFASQLLDVLDERASRLWRSHTLQIEALADLGPHLKARLLNSEVAMLPVKGGGFLTKTGLSAPFARELPVSLSDTAKAAIARRLLDWQDAQTEIRERRDTLGWCDENGVGDPMWEREWRSRHAVASLARYALWWQGAESEWKHERGLADFGDVTRAALSLLQAPEVSGALRSQIAWLLVDEFQDTNRDQWQIVQGLRRHARGDANAAQGNTLVVGDPKQAIYDFRGGDLGVFEAGRLALEREGARKENLSISRRSAPPVVEWTNRAFASVFPHEEAPREPFEAPHGPLDAAHEAWQDERADGDKPGVYVLRPPAWRDADFQPPAKPNIESLRQEAAHSLATWLLELFADAQTLTDGNGEFRQPNFAAISAHIARAEPAVAILFADNTVKGLFEEVLRSRGVPFVSLKGRGFYSSDAVRWSVLLWRALLDPDDESAWVGLLRSPFGGQSDTALLERHVARRSELSETEDYCPTDDLDTAMWRAAGQRLEQWRALAGVAPVSLVMERALEESEVAFYEAGQHDAAVRRENWRKLLDMVRARESEGEGGLRALVDFFEAHQGDDREPMAPLPSGASVQLMTVHASKGLGFPACVLAQLESPKRDGGDRTLLWGELNGEPLAAFSFNREREEETVGREKPRAPLAYELLKRAAFERSLAEWKRLFYVACTRAQSHLVLLETDANAPSGSWGALVRPALGGVADLLPSGQGTPASPQHSPTPQKIEVGPEPRPYVASTPREIRFDAIFGPPCASLKDTQKRAWLENHLRAQGRDTASVRQDVPFGARGALFEQNAEWLVGAWEWLAPLEDDHFLLLATGETEPVARARAQAQTRIALEAGLQISQTYALWPNESGAPASAQI